MSTSREHKYGPIVNNWNGSPSPQEYAAAVSGTPAAKWYVDLCHRIEREQAEESRRTALQGSFAVWRGPPQPQPNLRHNPLPPDLDARELELARGLSGVEIGDAVNTLAGAFGLAAEHVREMMDALARSFQVPMHLLLGSPPTSLSHTVIPAAPAWYVEYQAVPTDPSDRWVPMYQYVPAHVEYRECVRAAFTHSLRSGVTPYAAHMIVGRSHDLAIIDDVEVEGKW